MARSGMSKAALSERRLRVRDVMRRVLLMAVPAFMSSLLVKLMNLLNYRHRRFVYEPRRRVLRPDLHGDRLYAPARPEGRRCP